MSILTLIINSYNNSEYLDECLLSVANQTKLPDEIIIVDDNSTDNSFEIINNFRLLSFKTIIKNSKNMGISYSRNIAIDLTSSDYILFLDSDDVLFPDSIENIKKFLTTESPDLIYSDYELFGIVNRLEKPQYSDYSQLLLGNIFPISTVIRKKRVEEINGFNLNMNLGLEDWDFYIRYLNKTDIIINKLDTPIFKYRKKEDSRNKNMNRHLLSKDYLEMLDNIFQNNLNSYISAFGNPILFWRNSFIDSSKKVDGFNLKNILSKIKKRFKNGFL
jgi:glycosyltransferase involved in cell wall biosynthesis